MRKLDEKEPGTNLGVVCGIFAWSPDGTEIACCNFVDGPDKPEEVTHFVINVKTKEKKLLKLARGPHADRLVAGRKIPPHHAIPSGKGKCWSPSRQSCLVNRDGTEHKILTDEKQLSLFGRLSPDGTQVLYQLVTPPKAAKGKPKRDLAVLEIPTGKTTVVGDATLNGEIMGYSWSRDGKRIAYTWRTVHEGKPEIANKETESRFVVCDPNGKNATTIASEKADSPWAITLGGVDWR